jgi:hypothetical protein
MRRLLGLVLVSLLCLSNSSLSKGTRSNTGYSTRTGSSSHHSKSYCHTCARDSHGKIKRSQQAKSEFRSYDLALRDEPFAEATQTRNRLAVGQ